MAATSALCDRIIESWNCSNQERGYHMCGSNRFIAKLMHEEVMVL